MSYIFKHPFAWLPVVISLAVLVTMLLWIAIYGPPVRQPDEGIAAHLFQIWLGLEVLMIGFFAVNWLPKAPMQALLVLAIQIVAILAACLPVYYFHL